MQDVQTFMRLRVPDTTARTVWMFGFQRRRVRTCECETLLPKPGPLPQMSQTEATVRSIDRVGRVCRLPPPRLWRHPGRGSLQSISEPAPTARTVRWVCRTGIPGVLAPAPYEVKGPLASSIEGAGPFTSRLRRRGATSATEC